MRVHETSRADSLEEALGLFWHMLGLFTSRADSLEEAGQAVSHVVFVLVFSFSLSSTRARLEERPEES